MRFTRPEDKKTWKEGLILVLAVTLGLIAISYRKSLSDSSLEMIRWMVGR